jgi:hypothetical protein
MKPFKLILILLFIHCTKEPPCSPLDTSCNLTGYLLPNLLRRGVTIQTTNTTPTSTTSSITFAGASSLSILSATSVRLSWTPATSSTSSQSSLVYTVYSGSTSGGQNFSTPLATSSAGASEITLTGLTANTDYYLIVRARDPNGREDSNREEKAALLNGMIRYIPLDATTLTDKITGTAVTPANGPLLNATDRRGTANNAYTLVSASNQRFNYSTTNLPIGNANRTICFWVKLDSILVANIFSSYGIDAANQIFTYRFNSTASTLTLVTFSGPEASISLTADSSVNLLNWNHLCVSLQSLSLVSFYINGVPRLVNFSQGGPMITTLGDTTIGSNANGLGTTLNGKVAEFSFWNRALTASEIAIVYKN